MSQTVVVNGHATSSDWEKRYYHVDQILDRPGPRTDPSFAAGDEVRRASRDSLVVTAHL